MTKVGIIAEHPTDTHAMIALLNRKYEGVEWITLIRGKNGSELDNVKIKHLLRVEYQITKPDLVLFIRDLDSHEEDSESLDKRKAWFTDFKSVVDKKAILLLHIEEIESLLLADVSVLNRYYNVKLEEVDDCMKIKSPKEYIKERVKRYSQGDNRSLLGMCDYEVLLKRCRYFKKFDEDFQAKLN